MFQFTESCATSPCVCLYCAGLIAAKNRSVADAVVVAEADPGESL